MLIHWLSRNPLLVAFDVLALVVAIGCLIVLIRESTVFRGYRPYKRAAKSIARAIGGTWFRDGAMLVVNGFYRGIPVVVRFSTAENTPGVNLWMKVPARLNLFVFHKSAKHTEGHLLVPTGDSWFDDRFVVRTDQRETALALFADQSVVRDLKKVCCSPETLVTLENGGLEVSEPTIPQPNTSAHLLAHLESLSQIAVSIGTVSRKQKATIYLPDRYVAARVALALLVLAGLIEIVVAVRRFNAQPESAASTGAAGSAAVLSTQDELHLPAAAGWRLAEPADLDPQVLAWFQEHGYTVSTRYDGGFARMTEEPTTAYLLARKEKSPEQLSRVVLFSQHRPVLDVSFPHVLVLIRVPQNQLRQFEWQSSTVPFGNPDGDGLMVVRQTDSDKVAMVYTLSGGKVEVHEPKSLWIAGAGH